MKKRVVYPFVIATLLAGLAPVITPFLPVPAGAADEDPPASAPTSTPKKVVKSEKEWAKQLTRDQFLVTRMKATEPAFSGKLLNNHARGVYACVCCGAPLFSSRTKFNSGTGWPSFWSPVKDSQIDRAMDYHEVEPRVEVMCNTCGAHLGHVFNDGPPPTGLRYCINSVALKFVAETNAKEKAKANAKSTTKAKTNAKPDNDAPSAPDSPPSSSTSPPSDPPSSAAPPSSR